MRGAALAVLGVAWLAGRIACFASAAMPAWLSVVLDLAFPLGVAALVAREIVAARNRRNYAMLLPLLVLSIADLLMHLTALGVPLPVGLGWRLAIAAVLVLISAIGGRIVPAFTRNWLGARGVARLPQAGGLAERVGMGVLHTGLFAWVFLPAQPAVGVLLLAGAGMQFWRLARWRGVATTGEMLLFILHVGYFWLALGVGLLGVSVLAGEIVPAAAALHAITAGTFGTMLLAVMTRVSLGHTGRALHADASTVTIYVLVTLAALLRVAAGWPGSATMLLLEAAAAAWIAAFALFVGHYGPMLLAARPR